MVASIKGDSYLVLMILNSENSGYCEENRLKISDRNIPTGESFCPAKFRNCPNITSEHSEHFSLNTMSLKKFNFMSSSNFVANFDSIFRDYCKKFRKA
jgi:hypothetical protein